MPQFSVKTWLRTEVVALCILVVVVWILLSLPLLFYHLPEKTQVNSSCTDVNVSTTVVRKILCGEKRVWLK